MQENFYYTVRKSITGVHFALFGNFTKQDVTKFTAAIFEANIDDSRIFLDVRKLQPVQDDYCQDFKRCIAHVTPRQIIFKGEQGVRLGHHGNRILAMKNSPCQCAGACKSCACDKRVQNRNAKFTFHQKKID